MQLGSFCGCYSLKGGTIFTGVLGIVLSIISIILVYTTHVEWRMIIVDILDQSVVKIIYVINLCMTILISTLMLIGVFKKKTTLMIPWVILALMLVIGLLVSVLFNAIIHFIHAKWIEGALWIAFGVIADIIFAYLWFVVYSYFQQMKLDKMNGRIGPYGRPYNYRRP